LLAGGLRWFCAHGRIEETMMNQFQRRLLIALGLVCAMSTASRAGEWPGWRGPSGMGLCDEKDLPLTWDAKKGTNILWKAPLRGGEGTFCPGLSSPIVWRDRVFLTTAVYPAGNPFNDKVIAEHHVLCFRASDGTLLWDTVVSAGKFRVNNPWNGYATPTPVTDGEHVFALFGSSVVVALDFDGKIVWREELPLQWEANQSGECSSPLLYEDMVFVMGCQTQGLRALEKKTGKLKWELKPTRFGERYTMATPLLIRVADRPQLIHFLGGVQGLDPATGDVLWSCRVATDWASPVYGAGLIYADPGVKSTFPVGTPGTGAAIDPTGKGDVTKTHVKWQAKVAEAEGSSAIIVGDYLYRVSIPGILRCWKIQTGELTYDERLKGIATMASPIATADGRLYFACAATSYVIKAGPKFEVLGCSDLNDGGDYHASSSPAVSEGRLFIKGKTHLWCIGVK
jgi:outer membrane protein assembly factor BamB